MECFGNKAERQPVNGAYMNGVQGVVQRVGSKSERHSDLRGHSISSLTKGLQKTFEYIEHSDCLDPLIKREREREQGI